MEIDRHQSILRGRGSREILIQITGRAPVWVASARGWSCQERSARSSIALAEHLGYDIEVIGRRSARARAIDALLAAPAPRFPEQADPGGGRW
ncbi:hypothetical protein [Nocardioides aquaticus]|uniref:hypothetical protein n=1 Tax=Nocardioides aquaticus TaxID=160826 RepID=UPI001BD6BB07|nr:hypothetical protein [Nocardioides aquaticus]